VEKLTARQREMLQLLVEGRAMKEVADLLHETEGTVAFSQIHDHANLGIKTRRRAVTIFLEHGTLKKLT
jgi:DNA-binding CsgD family transcriptional regulator